jgi:hypothetical protein
VSRNGATSARSEILFPHSLDPQRTSRLPESGGLTFDLSGMPKAVLLERRVSHLVHS